MILLNPWSKIKCQIFADTYLNSVLPHFSLLAEPCFIARNISHNCLNAHQTEASYNNVIVLFILSRLFGETGEVSHSLPIQEKMGCHTTILHQLACFHPNPAKGLASIRQQIASFQKGKKCIT